MLLPEVEQYKVLIEWNQTQVDYPHNAFIHTEFESQVAQTPNAIAVVFEDKQLTYLELNQRANQLAHHLHHLGVKRETLVGICMERSLEMVIGLMAILKTGGAYVPLDPSYPSERLAYMLNDAQTPILLTQQHLLPKLANTPTRLCCLDADWPQIEHYPNTNVIHTTTAVHLAYVIYTSGSTGQPKGVMNTHGGIANRLFWMQAEYQLTSQDRVLQKTPFSFDVSVWEFFWPLMTGAQLIVAEPEGHKDPDYLVNLIQTQHITALHFVPSMLHIFLQTLNVEGCQSLRYVFCSGEALPFALKERFFQKLPHVELHNLYGPTEAAVDVTYWPCTQGGDNKIVPIGRPIANTQIFILNQQLHPVAVGEAGELHIGGANLARGYLNRPELTAEKFITTEIPGYKHKIRLYKTGDLVRYLPDGNIDYIDRIDNQIKIRGFRIELGEIESILDQHPAMQAQVVIVRENNFQEKQLVAYLVPNEKTAFPVLQCKKLEKQGILPENNWYELPNRMTIVQQNKTETEFIYQEIFEKNTYLKHGISLKPGDCVMDVGANIGLFSLFVGQHCPHAKIYAFEPIPAIFETLALNAQLYPIHITPLNYGLSNEVKTTTFSYYPYTSLISGQFANFEEEKAVVKAYLETQTSELSAPDIDSLLTQRLQAEQVTCQLTTLSQIIQEQAIQQIDLLKIDVEKGELDVLLGISEEDWPKIQQIVVEVHDIEDRLKVIETLLTQQGYQFTIEQENLLKDSGIYNIYAKKSSLNEITFQEPYNSTFSNIQWHTADHLINDVRQFLRNHLPDHMVPNTFVLLDSLPLTPNGKIDRKNLPIPDNRRSGVTVEFVAPQTEIEKTLATLWKNLLEIEKIGIYDNFFMIGGHSLLAIRLIAHIREKFYIDLPLSDLFKFPTIAALGEHLVQQKTTFDEISLKMEDISVFPLSLQQKSWWLFEQLHHNTPTYHIPVAFKLTGQFNKKILEKALTTIVQRHTSLRTVFRVNMLGEPQQHIIKVKNFRLKMIKVSKHHKNLCEATIHTLLSETTREPFDLTKDVLVRAHLLPIDKQHHILLFVFHHLITDGWSIGLFLKELNTIYNALLTKQPHNLPQPAYQYRDFYYWQQQWLQTENYKKQWEYWQKQLEQVSIVEILPDHPRPDVQTYHGARQSVTIPPELTQRLREFSYQQGVTLFMTMLTVFKVLLYRYTGQVDLTVGTSVAGREKAAWEQVMGLLMNSVSLRTRPMGKLTFLEFLDQVKHVTLEAFEHQTLPFHVLVEKLQKKPDLSHTPIFQTFFILQNFEFPNLALQNLQTTSVFVDPKSAKLDLVLELYEHTDQLTGWFEYNTDLFSIHTVSCMVQHFLSLLTHVLISPQQTLAAFPMFTSEDKVQAMYPLSPLQQGMLVHSLQTPGAYIEQVVMQLEEKLEVTRFIQAWEALVEHYAILRTCFRLTDVHHPRQQVFREVRLPIQQFDWSTQKAEEQNAQFKLFLQQDRQQGLNLNQAPLMRFAIFRYAQNYYQFVWTFHHALLDGRSRTKLLIEVFARYEALLNNQIYQENNVPTYQAFIDWLQLQQLKRGSVQQQFWQTLLADFDTPVRLLLPKNDEVGDAAQVVRLAPTLTENLVQLAKQHDLTVNNLLQGAWAILLHRYSEQEDIVFGTTRAGRYGHVEQAKNIAGVFINTLPVRIKFSSQVSLLETLHTLRQKWIDIRPYEHAALLDIQIWCGFSANRPLFDTLVIFENYERHAYLRSLGGKWLKRTLEVFDQGGIPLTVAGFLDQSLRINLRYDLAYYSHQQIEHISKHLVNLLESFVTYGLEHRFTDYSMLTVEEKNWLLHTCQPPAQQFQSCTVQRLFEIQVEKTPDNIAVILDKHSITYAQLNAKANNLAHYLRYLGVQPDTCVGISFERNINMMIGLWGILKAGAAYVPLDSSYPKERLTWMVENANMHLLVSTKHTAEHFPHSVQKVLLDDNGLIIEQSTPANPENPSNYSQLNHLAYVIYTSGTTGLPKGVMVEHHALSSFAQIAIQHYHIQASDKVLQFANLIFDASVEEIYPCLLQGATLVLRTPTMIDSLSGFLETCQQWGITVLDLPTAYWHELTTVLDVCSFPDSVRLAIIGGEAAHEESLKKWQNHVNTKVQLVNTYGPTEATVVATTSELSDAQQITIGKPLPGTEVYVLNQHRQLTPMGVAGELCIAGERLARGYLNNTNLTQEKFISQSSEKNDRLSETDYLSTNERGIIYTTGDKVRYTSDNQLEYLGRIDQQVKVRGFRIELTEIQTCLQQHPDVKQSVVTLKKSVDSQNLLVAYIKNQQRTTVSYPANIVPLQVEGQHPPIFWVDSKTENFYELASCLGQYQQPLYLFNVDKMLQDQALDSFITNLTTFQADTPYHICGWLKNRKVQEVAKQLEERGKKVILTLFTQEGLLIKRFKALTWKQGMHYSAVSHILKCKADRPGKLLESPNVIELTKLLVKIFQ